MLSLNSLLAEPLSRRCRPAECLASVVENRQVELPQAHGVGEYVDFDDLAARDREAHYRKRPSTLKHDGSCGSVNARRSYEGGEPREGERLLSHVLRTAHLPRCARRHATAVGSEDDVRVEHRDERFKVPVSCGSEEGVYDFSLASEIGVRNIGRSLHAAAGVSVSSTTCSASPTESASSASCSGSIPSSRLTIGSGTCTPEDSPSGPSWRALRERNMSRHTRATTVVIQLPRFSMPLVSERSRRSQASWAASSASLDEPSIR